jgi:hypothetical protein
MHVASIVLAYSLATYDPLAGALARFPPPEVVRANIEFNQAHSAWLEANEARLSRCNYNNWCLENDELGNCWRLLSEAQWDKERELVDREEALMELKQILGTTNFYLGSMPPPSPIWRFFDFPLPELPTKPKQARPFNCGQENEGAA